MAAINESLVTSKKSKDLVYFVEDDYIHRLDSLSEMIFAYENSLRYLRKSCFFFLQIILIYTKNLIVQIFFLEKSAIGEL